MGKDVIALLEGAELLIEQSRCLVEHTRRLVERSENPAKEPVVHTPKHAPSNSGSNQP